MNRVKTAEEAYAYCERLTCRRESNFSLGFPLLPPRRRKAIYTVYAFCRFVDDISDETEGESAGGIEAMLGRWKEELDRVYAGRPVDHPLSVALSDTLRFFDVPREGFEELVAGCVNDQSVKRYPDFGALERYCDLVANSISKLSLPVYGHDGRPEVYELGRNLSFAFQLTNILRDVAEDYRNGRIYIPKKELDEFGLTGEDLVAGQKTDAIRSLYARQGRRAESYFQSGLKVLQYLNPESRPCVRVMWEVYHTLLGKILDGPIRSLGGRTTLTDPEKQAILDAAAGAPGGEPRPC